MGKRLFVALLRLSFVAAAYVIAFAVFWKYPMPDRLFAIIPGTLLAALLLLIRKNQIEGVLFVGSLSLIGVLFSMVFFPTVGNREDQPRREIPIAATGALIGGVVGLTYHDYRHGSGANRSRDE